MNEYREYGRCKSRFAVLQKSGELVEFVIWRFVSVTNRPYSVSGKGRDMYKKTYRSRQGSHPSMTVSTSPRT